MFSINQFRLQTRNLKLIQSLMSKFLIDAANSRINFQNLQMMMNSNKSKIFKKSKNCTSQLGVYIKSAQDIEKGLKDQEGIQHMALRWHHWLNFLLNIAQQTLTISFKANQMKILMMIIMKYLLKADLPCKVSNSKLNKNKVLIQYLHILRIKIFR